MWNTLISSLLHLCRGLYNENIWLVWWQSSKCNFLRINNLLKRMWKTSHKRDKFTWTQMHYTPHHCSSPFLSAFSASAHLCVLVAVSSGVFQVLARAFVAVGVQVDGAGRSLSQELCPNVPRPLRNVLLGHPLQVLHRQPEPATQIKLTSDNY